LRRIASAGDAPHASRPVDAWLREGLARAQLHEVYAPDAADGPAALGFAVTLALAAQALPLIWVRTEEDERRTGRLHASGLVELGLSPDALVLVLAADAAAALRAAADVARCPGVGTLLLESSGTAPGLDLTATRRLQLAAEHSGVTILSVRLGAEPVPSAAATRWGVAAVPSVPLEANAPGGPAFDIELLRRKGGPAGTRWRVEWNRDARCFEPQDFGREAPALAGAGLPLAAGGAASLDPAAPVRGTG
jgi:protein ImuA